MTLATLARYHARFLVLLTLILVVAGIAGLRRVPQRWWPAVLDARLQVTASYPGATADQIERLILIPIEREVRVVNDIARVESRATPGRAELRVWMDEGSADRRRVVSDVRRAVDRAELPADLPERPRVIEWGTDDIPLLAVALPVSPGDVLAAQQTARRLERRLLGLPAVARISRAGWPARELHIDLLPSSLTHFQIAVPEIIAALQRQNVNVPGGSLVVGSASSAAIEHLVRVSGELRTPEEVARVVVRANDAGVVVRVGDVARVQWGHAIPETLESVAGASAILLFVHLRPGADGIAAAAAIRGQVQDFAASVGLGPSYPYDLSQALAIRAHTLRWGLLSGALVVALLLGAYAGLRRAGAVLLSAGLHCGLIAVLLVALGGGLNAVTIVALIAGIGIIIVQWCWALWSDSAPPAFPWVLAALGVAGVLPLWFLPGELGASARWVPMTLLGVLGISTVLAVAWVPVVAPPSPHRTGPWEERWERLVAGASRWRLPGWVCGLILLILTGIGIWGLRGSLQGLNAPLTAWALPREVRAVIVAEAPADWSLDAVEGAARAWLGADTARAWISTGARRHFPQDPEAVYGSRWVQIRSADAARRWRAHSDDATATAVGLQLQSTAQRSATTTAITLRGEELPALHAAAALVHERLRAARPRHAVWTDQAPSHTVWSLLMDEAQAWRAGVSAADVGAQVHAAYSGTIATTMRDDEEIDIVVRYPARWREQADAWQQLSVGNRAARLTALAQVARWRAEPIPAAITRIDRLRSVTVTAAGLVPAAVLRAILHEVSTQYPQPFVSVPSEAARARVRTVCLRLLMGLGLMVAVMAAVISPWRRWGPILAGALAALAGVVLAGAANGPVGWTAWYAATAVLIGVGWWQQWSPRAAPRAWLAVVLVLLFFLPMASGLCGADPLLCTLARGIIGAVMLGMICLTLVHNLIGERPK